MIRFSVLARGDHALKRVAASILDAKTALEEAKGFNLWVASIGQAMAEASKEGGFLGMGGERVTEKEKAGLKKLSTALGL